MLTRLALGTCALAVVALFAAAVLAQEGTVEEKIELAWKFKKDQKLEYVQSRSSIQTTSGPMQMKSTGMEEQGTALQVLEVDEAGTATFQQKFTRIKLSQETPMGKQEFDSAKKEDLEKAKEDPDLKIYAAMLEKPITLKMDKNGNILDVKGYEELFTEALKGNPNAEAAKEMFSNDAYKKIAQAGYSTLPAEPVAKGDSWNVKNDIPLGMAGNMKMELKLTLEGTETVGERLCARIKMELVEFALEGGMLAGATVSRKDGTGTFLFDIAEGIMVKTETKINFTLSMGNPMDPTMPGVEIASETTAVMKLKELVKEEKPEEKKPEEEKPDEAPTEGE